MLPRMDSNHKQAINSRSCYRYTTRDCVGKEGIEPVSSVLQTDALTTLAILTLEFASEERFELSVPVLETGGLPLTDSLKKGAFQ